MFYARMLIGNLTTNSVDPEKEVDGRFRGREKNIIIKDEFKEKPILLKGAPRGVSIKENMPMRAGALMDYLGLQGTKTDPKVIPRNGQPTVGNHLRCCHGRLLEKPIARQRKSHRKTAAPRIAPLTMVRASSNSVCSNQDRQGA